MTGPLYRLGRFCSRHHRAVIAVWLVAVIALAALGRAAGDQTNDNLSLPGTGAKAVIDGLASTGRVITSAALIMVCVFTSFILNGDPTVKQFGVGLAVAIAIDATLVRCLLVPAIMVVMGKAAWWLPRWLDRAMPEVSIEGEGYFR